MHDFRYYSFAFETTEDPPSIDIVALNRYQLPVRRNQSWPWTHPVTQAPPFPDNHKHAAATSSGEPILSSGNEPAMFFSNASRVAFIILERKGPRARVFTVMYGPRRFARCLDMLH